MILLGINQTSAIMPENLREKWWTGTKLIQENMIYDKKYTTEEAIRLSNNQSNHVQRWDMLLFFKEESLTSWLQITFT